MISRRDMVTAGVLGALVTNPDEAAAQGGGDAQQVREGLNKIADNLDVIKASLEGMHSNSMSHGSLGVIKQRLEVWVKATGKFPEFWDVGISVWLDIYDWHVRQQQQIQVTRISDQRMAVQWMFTQYVLRWELDPNYIAMQPYDR